MYENTRGPPGVVGGVGWSGVGKSGEDPGGGGGGYSQFFSGDQSQTVPYRAA